MEREEVAKALYCLSIIEEKVADAYETLSKKANTSIVRTLLEYISLDSRKHAVLLKGLASTLPEEPTEECEKFLGEAGKWIIDASKKAEDVSDLPTLIEKMATLESFIGEEYFAMIQLKSLRIIAEKEGIDLDNLNMVLDWTIQDEERHESILKLLKQKW